MNPETASRASGRPATITREDILDEVDRRIDLGWTVAGIAAELGVSKSAIFHYFASKDAILGALSERILDAWTLPATSDWRAWLMEYGLAWRTTVLKHPFLSSLGSWPQHVRTTRVEKVEPGIQVLVSAGFSVVDAVELVFAVSALGQVHATTELVQRAPAGPIEMPQLSPLLEQVVAVHNERTREDALRNALGMLLDGAAARLS